MSLIGAALLFLQLHTLFPLKNSYGHVFEVNEDKIAGSVVETVALYAKKNDSSDQKIVRYGTLVKKEKAKATILICHGFGCDKNDIGFFRYIFPDYNCMTFDFRAHGDNKEGQFCTLGKYECYDVISAAQFLRAHPDLQNKPLLVYGFSMGAVSAIEAQSKKASLFDGMVLDCPFDSAENVIKRGLESQKISLFGYEFHIPGRNILSKYIFHPYIQSFVKAFLAAVAGLSTSKIKTLVCPLCPSHSIRNVTVPCLFIHCKRDEKISVDAIKSIFYNAASKYKKLWITNGRRHFDSFFYNPEKYAARLRKFANKVVNGEIYKKMKHKIIEDLETPPVRSSVVIGDIAINKKEINRRK